MQPLMSQKRNKVQSQWMRHSLVSTKGHPKKGAPNHPLPVQEGGSKTKMGVEGGNQNSLNARTCDVHAHTIMTHVGTSTVTVCKLNSETTRPPVHVACSKTWRARTQTQKLPTLHSGR
eukprot:2237169-Amphidinium_carterae.1